MSVGAILLRFLSPPVATSDASSVFAAAVCSSLFPKTLPPVALSGVCGGVVNGTPATETLGRLPTVGVGLLMALASELSVVTDDADEDLVGELGWRTGGAGDGGSVGVEETLEDDGVEVGLGGVEEVGVGAAVGMGPVYFSPSSPGENTTTEQNPSVDVISKVLPSGDHVRSVNAA